MIYSLFDEFDTNLIVVSDFNILHRGVRVDCIVYDEDGGGNIHIWAGNPETDKYAEELQPTKAERKAIYEEILENF